MDIELITQASEETHFYDHYENPKQTISKRCHKW